MTGKKLQRLLACLLAVLLLSQVGAFSPAVFAADDSGYTLHDGTAVIPAGTSADDVNRILAAALVDGFDQITADEQQAILDKGFEYYCEGKNGLLKNTDWGLIGGFQSKKEKTAFGKVYTTYYDHPALAANKDGDYKVRLAGTTAEVTLTKAEKLSSSITLKEGVSVKLPYKEDGTLDFDALRAAILQQVVDEGTTPSLTTENTEIKYYATSSTGWAHEWVKLDGDKVNLATYPAISAGEQQIQISFKGDNTYKASSETTTVTFTERPSIEAVTKENPTFKLAFTADGAAIYDNIRQQVWDAVVVSTNPALTVDDVTIEYYATAESGSWGSVGKAWMPLEGGTKDLLTYPAIGEGTQEVRITWGGSKDYAAWQWQGNVAVTGRAAAPFTRKEGVTEVSMVYNKDQSINYEATAQALREALLVSADPNVSINDVTVEYNAGTDLAKNFRPLDFDGFGFKFGLNEQTIRFTWRGNADYQAYTAEVTVEMTDSREASAIVLKPSISLIYNKDAAAMTQQIFEYVIDWDDSTLPDKSTLSADDFTIEYYATAKVVAGDLGGDVGLQKWVPIEGEEGISVGKLQYFYPQMGAGEQHFRAVAVQKRLVVRQVDIMPDAVGYRRARLQLQAGVLPERAGFVAVERRNRVTCALAVQHFCAFQRHRQRVVAEKKERFRGFRVREEVERQAAGFRVPECVAVVRLARQAFRANVVAHTAAVVGLRELKGAEANPLLFRCDGFRHAFIFRLNADVGRVPVGVPVRALCHLCVIERDGFALRHRVLPALPEVIPLLTVEQHDGALVDLHGLPRRKQNIRRRGDGFALGGCGRFAGQRQPCATKLLLIR